MKKPLQRALLAVEALLCTPAVTAAGDLQPVWLARHPPVRVMKTRRIIAVGLLAALLPAVVLAQGPPDVVWRVQGHTGSVNSVGFSADGLYVGSGGSDATVKLWRVTDGSLTLTLSNSTDEVRAIAFSPITNFLAVGGEGGNFGRHSIKLWSIPEGSLLRELRSSDGPFAYIARVGALAFSPDGALLAVGDRVYPGFVVLWTMPDGAFFGVTDFPAGVSSIDFSSDGSVLAIGGHAEADISLRSTESGELLGTLYTSAMTGGVLSLDFSPDGRTLAAGGTRGGIDIWRWQERALLRLLSGHSGMVTSVGFMPHGRILLSSSQDNTIRFWRVVNGRQIRLYDQETTGVNSIAISPDGRFFAYGRSDGTVVLARMPTFISNIRRQGNQTFVEWEGGIGPYQLQQCMDLVGDAWQNVGGPTTNTSATVSGTHTQIFYRVQSLPSGP